MVTIGPLTKSPTLLMEESSTLSATRWPGVNPCSAATREQSVVTGVVFTAVITCATFNVEAAGESAAIPKIERARVRRADRVPEVGERRRRGERLGLRHFEVPLVEKLALVRRGAEEILPGDHLAVGVEVPVAQVVERVQLGDVDVGQQDLARERMIVRRRDMDVLRDRRGVPRREDVVVDRRAGRDQRRHNDDHGEAGQQLRPEATPSAGTAAAAAGPAAARVGTPPASGRASLEVGFAAASPSAVASGSDILGR